jgi:lipopolysaccharide export system permease protein
MKILDKYIIRKFLGTFFYSIGLIICITIIFDISEKLDDFLNSNAPVQAIIFGYYLNFIPYFVNLFSPLFTFISVIFFTSRMAYNTEIVAILSSGVSFARFTRPYLISSAVLAVLSFLLLNFVIPVANKNRLAFEETYINNKFHYSELNIHRQIQPGEFVYFESFNNNEKQGYKFSLERFQLGKLTYKLNAEILQWDSLKNCWTAHNFTERTLHASGESLRTGDTTTVRMKLQLAEFTTRSNNIQTMNLFDLERFINQEKMKGSEQITFYLVEKHQRISLPFATFVLTIIGVALSSRKVRGGIGFHIGAGVALSFIYILFMQVSNTFATAGNAPVMLAVWIPNIVFSLVAAALYIKSPK